MSSRREQAPWPSRVVIDDGHPGASSTGHILQPGPRTCDLRKSVRGQKTLKPEAATGKLDTSGQNKRSGVFVCKERWVLIQDVSALVHDDDYTVNQTDFYFISMNLKPAGGTNSTQPVSPDPRHAPRFNSVCFNSVCRFATKSPCYQSFSLQYLNQYTHFMFLLSVKVCSSVTLASPLKQEPTRHLVWIDSLSFLQSRHIPIPHARGVKNCFSHSLSTQSNVKLLFKVIH